MTRHELTRIPVVKAQMLIRKPVHKVFEAFIDPAATTHFWFTRSSGKLAPDTTVEWKWEMYDASATVKVQKLEKDKQIVIKWGDEKSGFTTVEWRFFPQDTKTTFVTISESGFSGSGDQIAAQAINSMGGFTNLLAAAKAYLEHKIELNLVVDHVPKDVKLRELTV